jgi:protein-S-isoprenylcysteine O-methyltransferase Ste14
LTKQIIKNLAFGLVALVPILALVILGWGDLRSFFSHPARIGVVILVLAGTIAYSMTGSSSWGTGRREDPSSRWIFVPLIVLVIVFAWLPPRLDRLDTWTIDGDTCRYLGLIMTALGGYIRLATIFELGHRFSIFVAVQANHELKTDGFYAFVRHPSYLGALLSMIGWALVFRSVAGLLLTLAVSIFIGIRIHAEEDFLVREFGEQFRAYKIRTRWRLLPLIY